MQDMDIREERDYYSNILDPSDFTYSGSTRWVFYESCSTIKYPVYGNIPCSTLAPGNKIKCCPNESAGDACFGGQINGAGTAFVDNEGLNWFSDRFASNSGPHAILGFASLMVFYSNDANGCVWNVNVNGYSPNYSNNGSDYCPQDNSSVLFNSTFWNDVIVENLSIWEAYKNAVEQREFNFGADPQSVEASIVYKTRASIGFSGELETWNSTYRGSMSSSDLIRTKTYVFKRLVQQGYIFVYEYPTYFPEG